MVVDVDKANGSDIRAAFERGRAPRGYVAPASVALPSCPRSEPSANEVFSMTPTAATTNQRINDVYRRLACAIRGRGTRLSSEGAARLNALDRARDKIFELRDEARAAALEQRQVEKMNKKRGVISKTPVKYTLVEGPPMNVEAAQTLVRTRDFSDTQPWGGSITMFAAVQAFSRRALVRKKGVAYLFAIDLYFECTLATEVGEKLRLVGGFRGGAMPEATLREEAAAVPRFLLGFPLAQAPRIIRRIFFIEVAPPVMEGDLVAAHLRAARVRMQKKGIRCSDLDAYVDSEESVRSFRKLAATDSVPPVRPDDIKRLMNATGYGSSGEAWKAETGVDVLPGPVTSIKRGVNALIAMTWEEAEGVKREVCERRERPPLTLHAIEGQVIERQWLEMLKAHMFERFSVEISGWNNDALVYWSRTGKLPRELGQAQEALGANGVLFSVASLTMTAEEYKTFAMQKFGKMSWDPLPADVLAARKAGAEFLRWLYPSPEAYVAHPAQPYNYAAAAVAPFIHYNHNVSNNKTEFWDEGAKVWKDEGGEYMIKGIPLQKVLQDRLVTYRMEPVQKEDGQSFRMTPVRSPPHDLLADPACTNAVGAALKTICKGYPPLGGLSACKHQLVCSNGITIDFSKPYEEQVIQSTPEHRNVQQTKWAFIAPTDAKRSHRRQLATEMAEYLNHYDVEKHGQPQLAEAFGRRLVEYMADDGDAMFQHVYYEPAGGRLDGHDPLIGLEEALFSLRQDVGAASGMREGFEEWLLEWGPLGNNGKGQKRELREAALSRVDRAEERGYIAVVDAALLKDAKDENRCNEDKVKLKNAREAVVDEPDTEGKKFVNATVKEYSGGGVVSGHGKHEKPKNIETNFLLRVIANEFPEFQRKLKMPDVRRIALVYYPDTFQPTDILAQHPGNAHYRPLVEYKLGVREYVPVYVDWMRLLAGATKASGKPGMPTKRLWPRPASSDELLSAQLPPVEEDLVEKFVRDGLVPLPDPQVPDSRSKIARAFVLHSHNILESSGKRFAECQLLLRGVLSAPDRQWSARRGGAQVKVNVFRNAEGEVMTLSDTMKQKLQDAETQAGGS